MLNIVESKDGKVITHWKISETKYIKLKREKE